MKDIDVKSVSYHYLVIIIRGYVSQVKLAEPKDIDRDKS